MLGPMNTFTMQQEAELFRRWRGDGDRQALTVILQSVRPYALHLARGLRSNRAGWEDAVAEAMAGALDAANRFDPDRGVRFVTYAAHWMRAAIIASTRRAADHAADDLGEREESIASADEGAEAAIGATQAALIVRELAATLEPRLRAIVESRFLSDEPPSLAIIARELGLSRERARQLEHEALEKLRRRARVVRLTTDDLLAA